mgnify:CR=1 FL=1
MEENKKQTVEMTAEEAEAFKQFQEKQAKEKAAKKRKEDRELTPSWWTARLRVPSPNFAACQNRCLQ